MKQEIIDLYDEYTHKPLSRNEFINRLIKITGSMMAAMAVLPLIECNTAKVVTVPEGELFTEMVSYPGVPGTMKAYVARPKAKRPFAAVVVFHENRGLTTHIEDVARRAARAGYLAIAPDALSAIDAKPANEDEARAKFQELKADNNLQNFINVFDYLPKRDDYNGKAGCVGFCWGGAMASNLAINVPSLKAAVAFYGRQPALENVGKIKAAVQLHYASLDKGVNAGMEAYEAALKQHNITYEQYMYENVNHAFHNDTSEARYNEVAAKLAWQRTLDFFKKHLC